MSREELKKRWVGLLRDKASQYEHSARGRGEEVTSPSIDSICSEIEAFFAGLCDDYAK
jgi:hypothetical protein